MDIKKIIKRKEYIQLTGDSQNKVWEQWLKFRKDYKIYETTHRIIDVNFDGTTRCTYKIIITPKNIIDRVLDFIRG